MGDNRKVGTLERRNPLPAGQYWVDVFGLNIPKADRWFKAFSGLGVHVDSTQHFEATSLPEVRTWYKWTYTPLFDSPVIWDTSLGFPTVADSSITASSDTVSRPDLPLDPLDELSNWLNSIEQKLGGSLGAVATVVPYAIIGVGLYAGYLLYGALGMTRKVKRSAKRNA